MGERHNKTTMSHCIVSIYHISECSQRQMQCHICEGSATLGPSLFLIVLKIRQVQMQGLDGPESNKFILFIYLFFSSNSVQNLWQIQYITCSTLMEHSKCAFTSKHNLSTSKSTTYVGSDILTTNSSNEIHIQEYTLILVVLMYLLSSFITLNINSPSK